MTHPRAGMPFTGIASFARAPVAADAAALAAARPHFAVFGFPFDCAIGYRPGPRLAPRAIRDMSTRFALPWGPENPGYWDVEEQRPFMQGLRLVDAGDVDPLYFDLDHLDRSAAELVGAILDAGAVPVGLGGDHSVTFPIIKGFTGRGDLAIVQLDAHLDYMDAVAGFPRSNSSPIRRAAELPFVQEIVTIGIRGMRTNEAAYRAALARGNRVVLQADLRRRGLESALAALPRGKRCYVTIDVDALDPAAAPGTSSPEFEGMTVSELRAILQAVADQNEVAGFDVVEVNPYLDPTGVTSLLAARIALEFMARIHSRRGG